MQIKASKFNFVCMQSRRISVPTLVRVFDVLLMIDSENLLPLHGNNKDSDQTGLCWAHMLCSMFLSCNVSYLASTSICFRHCRDRITWFVGEPVCDIIVLFILHMCTCSASRLNLSIGASPFDIKTTLPYLLCHHLSVRQYKVV